MSDYEQKVQTQLDTKSTEKSLEIFPLPELNILF